MARTLVATQIAVAFNSTTGKNKLYAVDGHGYVYSYDSEEKIWNLIPMNVKEKK